MGVYAVCFAAQATGLLDIEEVPLPDHGRQKFVRAIGLAKGTFQVPDTFFEELPEECVSLFNGDVS